VNVVNLARIDFAVASARPGDFPTTAAVDVCAGFPASGWRLALALFPPFAT